MYVIGSFFGKPDLLGKFYLYIGITSLCLYISIGFFVLQDGIVHKLTVLFLCEIQICAQHRHILLTFKKGHAIVIVLGQICSDAYGKAAEWFFHPAASIFTVAIGISPNRLIFDICIVKSQCALGKFHRNSRTLQNAAILGRSNRDL